MDEDYHRFGVPPWTSLLAASTTKVGLHDEVPQERCYK
jgi:hypothetical protein